MQHTGLISTAWPMGLRAELVISVYEDCDDGESRVYNGQMLKQFLCVFHRGEG